MEYPDYWLCDCCGDYVPEAEAIVTDDTAICLDCDAFIKAVEDEAGRETVNGT